MKTKRNVLSTAVAVSLSAFSVMSATAQDFDFTGRDLLPANIVNFTSSDDFIHVQVSGTLTDDGSALPSRVTRASYGLGLDAHGADTIDMDNAGNTVVYQEGWDRMEFSFDTAVTLNSISFSTWEASTLTLADDAADVYAEVDGSWVFLGRAETLNPADITTTIRTSAVHSVYYTHSFTADVEATRFAVQVPELTSGERPIEFRVAGLSVTAAGFDENGGGDEACGGGYDEGDGGEYDEGDGGEYSDDCGQCEPQEQLNYADSARILFTDATPSPAPWMNFFSEDARVEVNVKALFTRDLEYVAVPSFVTRMIHGLGSQAFGESTDMDNVGNTIVQTEGWDRLELTFDQPVSLDKISFSTWENNNFLWDEDAADIYAFVNGVWEFVERAETSSYGDLKWRIKGTNVVSSYYNHKLNASPISARFAIQVPELKTGERPIEFRVAAIKVTPAGHVDPESSSNCSDEAP